MRYQFCKSFIEDYYNMIRKIKSQLALLIVVLVLPTTILAQKNDVRLNIGIPLGKYGKFDHNFMGTNETNSPSFIIQLEKNWKPDLSIGAYVGYAGQKHEFNLGFDEVKYNYYRFGTVLTYELNGWLSEMNIAPDNGIEMYASVKTGLSLENRKSTISRLDGGNVPTVRTNRNNELLFDLGVLLGTRYHFSNQFGIFAELGWGNAGFFTIGTTFTL
ncbi:outer membrane beta-barrel protein [Labilibaculum euxinus]|uniref:outer membrane beta-barrel protein n=1 Tax=Labilibaculum euxinus TaxID=2686357 RepID=UPI000F624F43|nr:outer membrane beta-barrel protein [Labilibaculum euxinus]MDQ1772218.1 outer membrane beta-barrel protein [Labilibaculum euxinus]